MESLNINDFRSIITVCGMLCFLVICFWAYNKKSQSGFSEAANIPLNDDDVVLSVSEQKNNKFSEK